MRTLIFKLNCLLLVVRSVAQSDPYSLVPIPSYPVVTSDDSSWSPQLGDGQLGNIAFDSTSPPKSNLASPVAEERIAQCPTTEIHQRSRKLRQREESCPNPLANPLNGKIVPANEKKKYTSDRPWWQRLWRADDPEPDLSRIYDETEPYQADEETCPDPSRRFPVCTTYGAENLYPPPANMLNLPSCRIPMVTAINSCQKPLETFYCCESVDYSNPVLSRVDFGVWARYPREGFRCSRGMPQFGSK